MKRSLLPLLAAMLLLCACGQTETGITLPQVDALFYMDGDDSNVEDDYYLLSQEEQTELSALLAPERWEIVPPEEVPQHGTLTLLTAVNRQSGEGYFISWCEELGLLARINGEDTVYRLPAELQEPLEAWSGEREAAWKKQRVLAMVQTLDTATHEIEDGRARIVGPITPAQREELMILLQTENWTQADAAKEIATEFQVLILLTGEANGEMLYVGMRLDGSAIIKAVWSQGMITTLYDAPQAVIQPVEEFAATLTGERLTFD